MEPKQQTEKPLNIKIPVELKKWLAIQSIKEDRDMTDIVIEALKDYRGSLSTKI